MISVMARYRVKKDRVKDIIKAVKEFVKDVEKKEKGTLSYMAFQLAKNPGDFVHFMNFEDKKAEAIHRKSGYVKKFVSVLYSSCERKPIFTNLNRIK